MENHTYYTTSFRGIGKITHTEISQKLEYQATRFEHCYTRNYDINIFSAKTDPKKLLELRTTEDVFYLIKQLKLTGQKSDLKEIVKIIGLSRNFEDGLPKRARHYTFKVVVQANDVSWRNYRRIDIQQALETGIQGRFPDWKMVPEEAQIEVWAQQSARELIFGIRLSDNSMRHRDYKEANIPGSLRPTIAAALVRISKPKDDEVILDPMCGAGTILLERAVAGRYKMLLGGDSDPIAVEAALKNFGPRHKPREIKNWDALHLPLEDRSVDTIITNPPWDKKISVGEENDLLSFYTDFLKESQRVIKPSGKLVLITSQWRALRDASKTAGLKIVEQIENISVQGWHADAFILTPHEK